MSYTNMLIQNGNKWLDILLDQCLSSCLFIYRVNQPHIFGLYIGNVIESIPRPLAIRALHALSIR